MKDGLYQVSYKSICAGFVVEGGRITMCAPVLRKRLNYWQTIATRVEEQMPETISAFIGGDYGFLSNFYDGDVTLRHRLWGYPTTEHYYQAMKTLDKVEREKFKTGTPGQAKRLGRKVNLRPDWEEIKDEVMMVGLRQKFNITSGFVSTTDLGRRLIATGDAYLIEGNNWHDNYWGNCSCGREACKPIGANVLGRMLMQIRDELRGF